MVDILPFSSEMAVERIFFALSLFERYAKALYTAQREALYLCESANKFSSDTEILFKILGSSIRIHYLCLVNLFNIDFDAKIRRKFNKPI